MLTKTKCGLADERDMALQHDKDADVDITDVDPQLSQDVGSDDDDDKKLAARDHPARKIATGADNNAEDGNGSDAFLRRH